jgi:uncharacterized protein (DUF58 family)
MKPPRRLAFTREGRYFVGITLGVGLAAINTGNNLLYLILGMMLSLIILSGILSEMALREVRVRRDPPSRLYAQRPFLMSMAVSNGKRRFPSFSIEVEDLVAGEALDKRCYFLKIPAGRTQETSYRYHFERRGRYTYDAVRISTKFPFALFRKSLEAALPAEVLVYPRIDPVQDAAWLDQPRPGDQAHATRGRGGEFHGLREWRDGDDLSDVHWRTTAHAGRLMVREHEVEATRGVSILLDNARESEDDPVEEAEMEEAISYAASLASHILDRGVEVELQARGTHVPPGRGADHRWRILATLALIELVPAASAEPFPANASGRERIVIDRTVRRDGRGTTA